MQAPLQARSDSDAAQTDIARIVAQKRVFADNRPDAAARRKLAETIDNSPRVLQQRALSNAIHNSPRMVAQRHQMNALFGGAVKPQGDGVSPAQRVEKNNNAGLPDQLKQGIESLSGISMDHVKVHYNSNKPGQLRAHAYAQGSDIHVAPGQESHLPHEAWHLVQQAQGRVQPRRLENGVAINDDVVLEAEADRVGAQALQHAHAPGEKSASRRLAPGAVPAQRKLFISGVEQTDAAATFRDLDKFASERVEPDPLRTVWTAADPQQATIARMISAGGWLFKAMAWEALYKVYGRQRTLPYRYADESQAIRGVAGETSRDQAERIESDLATQVLNSESVTSNLRSASKKIAAAVANWKAGTLQKPTGVAAAAPVPSTLGDQPQKYKHYYSYLSPMESLLSKVGRQNTPSRVLNNAQRSGQGPLIASIHDLTDQLHDDADWSPAVTVPDWRRVAHYRDAFQQIQTEPIDTVRTDLINENSEVMKQTRAAGMAVDVGPSYTTGRMLMLAESVNSSYDKQGQQDRWDLKISDGEMTAVALALFAFWNKTYWEATSGIHKYKFVIDMLSNFVDGADSTRYPANLTAFIKQTRDRTDELNRTWEPPVDVVVEP